MADIQDTKYHQKLARTISLLESVSDSSVCELSLVHIYAVECALAEHNKIDTDDTRVWAGLGALTLFCRTVRLLLDRGMDPKEISTQIDPSEDFSFFCDLCIDALRMALDSDQGELRLTA